MVNDTRKPPQPHEERAPTRALSRQVPLDLVDVASEIQRADQVLGIMTAGKLKVIADQIRKLQEHARSLLEQARLDASLHAATCAFRKRPGHIYHLYRKKDASLQFSMLSPADWGGSPPDTFEGSFRLESDMSWTPAEQVESHDESYAAIRNLLEPLGND